MSPDGGGGAQDGATSSDGGGVTEDAATSGGCDPLTRRQSANGPDVGCAIDDAGATTDAADAALDGAVPRSRESAGGCALSSPSALGTVGPWLLAALVPLALRRRRR